MKKKLTYSSTIKTRPYFYMETRKLAHHLLQGLNKEELLEKVMVDNILQFQTDRRKREVFTTIMKRLEQLDDELLHHLVNSDTETSKLLVLYSILKTDRLFFEFMNEVYKEKIHLLDMSLTNRDFFNFFEAKRQQSEKVASWKDYTFYKLQQVYIRILYEAGLLKTQKEPRELQVGMLNYTVKEHLLAKAEHTYIEILTGERV